LKPRKIYSYDTSELIFIHHYQRQNLNFIWHGVIDQDHGFGERFYVQKTKEFKEENIAKLAKHEKEALQDTVDLSGFQREFEAFSRNKRVYIGHSILKALEFLKERYSSYKELNPFDHWQNKYTPIDPIKLDVWVGNDQYSTLTPDQYQKLDSGASSVVQKVQLYFDYQMEYEKCKSLSYEQISKYSIGDYKLPGKWFYVNEKNEACFKMGKYKNQAVHARNENHINYIKWLKRGKFPNDGGDIRKTKEEEEFIKEFLKYAK
jgi:hypothetical protein